MREGEAVGWESGGGCGRGEGQREAPRGSGLPSSGQRVEEARRARHGERAREARGGQKVKPSSVTPIGAREALDISKSRGDGVGVEGGVSLPLPSRGLIRPHDVKFGDALLNQLVPGDMIPLCKELTATSSGNRRSPFPVFKRLPSDSVPLHSRERLLVPSTRPLIAPRHALVVAHALE